MDCNLKENVNRYPLTISMNKFKVEIIYCIYDLRFKKQKSGIRYHSSRLQYTEVVHDVHHFWLRMLKSYWNQFV